MNIFKQIAIKIINEIAPEYLRKRQLKKEQKLFFKKHEKLINKQKILYALTPPPKLSNIGDHGQVVAIYKWLNDNYSNMPILEIDKSECVTMIKPLKKIINKNDLIFIHSGGNLGDRGIWSETGRRSIIQNFPKNKIISLPQTIYFSDTEKGRAEKKRTELIYNQHRNLTVIGRDLESGKLAKKMFANCKTFAMPDFVLYLQAEDLLKTRNENPKGTLLCLRNDNESILTEEKRKRLHKSAIKPIDYFDTTINKPINCSLRLKYLIDTLRYFDQFEIIITDRYHGLIFATILQKPTIVLPTVDHKLSSAFNWFQEISNITLLNENDYENIDKITKELLSAKVKLFKWDEKYFNNLKNMI
ncbi:MAG: polysaccharide pyruvyl transferase family protein [Bacteroidales bacterium]|nr:polysaccharide pyruvyl transferase family protein [Bacteroidales bacterium]